MPRADDRHRQLISRQQRAADEQHARRVVNLLQQGRIGGVRCQQNLNVVRASEFQLLVNVHVVAGANNAFGKRRSDT